VINKFLDISSAYITRTDSQFLHYMRETRPAKKRVGPRVIAHKYGWFVHIDQTPSIYADHIADLKMLSMSDEFLILMEYAHSRGCWWINIDQDGEDIRNAKSLGLKKFNW
jgi:hypothetical protein